MPFFHAHVGVSVCDHSSRSLRIALSAYANERFRLSISVPEGIAPSVYWSTRSWFASHYSDSSASSRYRQIAYVGLLIVWHIMVGQADRRFVRAQTPVVLRFDCRSLWRFRRRATTHSGSRARDRPGGVSACARQGPLWNSSSFWRSADSAAPGTAVVPITENMRLLFGHVLPPSSISV